MAEKKYRVIQWATGVVGSAALKYFIENPFIELVGVLVTNPEKVGKDAGDLVGLPKTGVLATDDEEAIIAMDADCVLFAPSMMTPPIDNVCRLLASGKNVVTTRGDFHHPPMMDADIRSRIEAACEAGKSAIYSTGSSPGFVTEALTLPLLSLSRRLDCLTIDEFADLGTRNSPQLLFEIMGFGQPMTEFHPARAAHVKADFASSLAQAAEACELQVDSWEAHGEYAAARETVPIAAGDIEQGTIAAQRITVAGLRNGKPCLQFRANWYATDKIERDDWELRESGWRIKVEGDTPLDLGITFPVAPEDYAAFTPGLTAHRAVNAVEAVCSAAPGIRTTVDLPQVAAFLGNCPL